MEEKKTSKREYRFVIRPEEGRVTIIDANDNELRDFRTTALTPEIRNILLVHGLKQKLTDDTMVSKIGEEDRLVALDTLWDQLKSGEWEKERQGVARPPEALIRLVAELKQIPRAVSEASLKSAGKEKWDAIKAAHAPRIAKIEAAIKEEKSKAEGIDLDDLTK